jgi:hypothetical protein
LYRYLRRAGLPCWPKPFVNMRSSRQTELAEFFPEHVVAAWLGNSPTVARAHYLQVTDAHFRQAQERITALESESGHCDSKGSKLTIPFCYLRTESLRTQAQEGQGQTHAEVTPENRAAKSAAMPQQNPQLQETAASSKQRKNFAASYGKLGQYAVRCRAVRCRLVPLRTGDRTTPGRIRTCNLGIRNPLLYPVELRGQCGCFPSRSACPLRSPGRQDSQPGRCRCFPSRSTCRPSGVCQRDCQSRGNGDNPVA